MADLNAQAADIADVAPQGTAVGWGAARLLPGRRWIVTSALTWGATTSVVGAWAQTERPEATGRDAPVAPGLRPVSRWTPVPWSELPGFESDALSDGWNAWLQSCARPAPALGAWCAPMRRMVLASDAERRDWLQRHFVPHRIQARASEGDAPGQPDADGLLTAYFEPVLTATRERVEPFVVPLYRPPAGLGRSRWHSREAIDTHPDAQAALAGRELLWVTDPLDALLVHIQGSARFRVREADGRERDVRLAYAASNEHPYRSVGGWLLQQRELTDASWPGIRAWAARNPDRVQSMLWSNPRYVFFRELPMDAAQTAEGPTGAQGVPLTAGRSIAVDPQSIPYGTPVWLASPGPTLALQRLVVAQDTGSAIRGAVRADYFVGSGAAAGDIAGRLKQPLRMWALWPKGAAGG